MKEGMVVDTILINTNMRTGQRIQTTAESVQNIISAGGLPRATAMGIELKQAVPVTTKPFNEILVPLYPTVQETLNVQN